MQYLNSIIPIITLNREIKNVNQKQHPLYTIYKKCSLNIKIHAGLSTSMENIYHKNGKNKKQVRLCLYQRK